MGELFGRRAVLQIGTRRIDALRIAFKVEKADQSEPNSSEISTWNLSATTRGAIEDETQTVILEAGYGEDISQVFSGDIRVDGISSRREGPDWITTLKGQDGGDAFRRARIQESLAAGTKLVPVLNKLASSMGVGIGNAIEKLKGGDTSGALEEFFGGATLSGQTHKVMERTLRSVGYDYSVQDGELVVTRLGEANDDEAVVLSPETGLIGSPEPGAKGLTKMRCLLQTRIRPRTKVKLETAQLNGFYLVRRMKAVGDTHGQPWYCEIEGTQI